MARPIAVLRPEPGNRVIAAAIEARGREAIRLPLFEARPLAWEAPDPRDFDALIVTSANAIRHGGAGLDRLTGLPLYAVGEPTAEAARRNGFQVARVGDAGSAELLALAEAAGVRRALHLAGRERSVEEGGIVARVIAVYASEILPVSEAQLAGLAGSVVLVQSARAGARLAELVRERANISIVAIGERAAKASGTGWRTVIVPEGIASETLIDAAIALAD